MVLGSEAYAATLVAYKYAKDSGLGAGLDGVVNDIGLFVNLRKPKNLQRFKSIL